jgi:hypothetical protein
VNNVSSDFKWCAKDYKVAKGLLRHENTRAAFDYFWARQDKLTDYGYWYMLGTLWVLNPLDIHIDDWRDLFTNPRRKLIRSSLMKPDELQAWRALPDTVQCWRAVSGREYRPMSFTTSRGVADLMARVDLRIVEQFEIPKKEVTAYFLRCGEFEILRP